MKACTNLPHPIFFDIFAIFFLKNNTDLIEQVCGSSVDGGSLFMVNFGKVHLNFEEESRKWVIRKKVSMTLAKAFFKFCIKVVTYLHYATFYGERWATMEVIFG